VLSACGGSALASALNRPATITAFSPLSVDCHGFHGHLASSFVGDTLRLAGPTLAFERGAVTIRIEGAIGEAQALAIAHSLR
jgi:hypothetical protein